MNAGDNLPDIPDIGVRLAASAAAAKQLRAELAKGGAVSLGMVTYFLVAIPGLAAAHRETLSWEIASALEARGCSTGGATAGAVLASLVLAAGAQRRPLPEDEIERCVGAFVSASGGLTASTNDVANVLGTALRAAKERAAEVWVDRLSEVQREMARRDALSPVDLWWQERVEAIQANVLRARRWMFGRAKRLRLACGRGLDGARRLTRRARGVAMQSAFCLAGTAMVGCIAYWGWSVMSSSTGAALAAWVIGVVGSAEFLAAAVVLPALAGATGALLGNADRKARERLLRERHRAEERRVGGVPIPMRPILLENRAGVYARRAAAGALVLGLPIGLVVAPVGVAPAGLVIAGEEPFRDQGVRDVGGYIIRAGWGDRVDILDWAAAEGERLVTWHVVDSRTSRLRRSASVREADLGASLRACGWFCRPRSDTPVTFAAQAARTARVRADWTLDRLDEWVSHIDLSASRISLTLATAEAIASVPFPLERADRLRPHLQDLANRNREIGLLADGADVHRHRIERFIPDGSEERRKAEEALKMPAALRMYRNAVARHIESCFMPGGGARPETCASKPVWVEREEAMPSALVTAN